MQIIVAVAINKERPPLPHDTPPRLASLILRCWSENPAGRPRVNQLLAELSDMMRVSQRDDPRSYMSRGEAGPIPTTCGPSVRLRHPALYNSLHSQT